MVVTGLKAGDYPRGMSERKEFLSSAMHPYLESIIGETVFDIYSRNAYLHGDKIPPSVIQFPTKNDCQKF